MILLIEDDHDIRDSFRQILEDMGHSVLSAANGWDAIALLEKIPNPLLIILDLSMPIMNGEEFLKLKEAHPKLSEIPVLIASSHENRIGELRNYPFIKKPVDMEAFIKKVNLCLKP